MKKGQRFIRSVGNPDNSGDIVEIIEVSLGWVEYKIIEGNGLYTHNAEGEGYYLPIEDFNRVYKPIQNSIQKTS